MSTLTRTVLAILVVILGALVVLPFVLSLIGIDLFSFGGAGGGGFFGGSNQSILISFDAKEWVNADFVREKTVEPPTNFLDIAFHPQHEGIFFLGTQKNGLWKSIDAGKTWQKQTDQKGALLPASDVYRIAGAPSNPQIIYLATFQNNRGRVLKSEDGGDSFREIYFVSADRFGVFDIFVDTFNAEHVLIVTGQGGLLETDDGGFSWHVRHWFGEALTRLMVNPNNTNEIYVVSQSGRFSKTKDGGKTWTNALEGFTRQSRAANTQSTNQFTTPQSPLMFDFSGFGAGTVTYFMPDRYIFSTVYMIRNGNVWRTVNGGEAWEQIQIIVPPNASMVSAFAAYPGRSNPLFAAVGNQLYRSDDGGREWSFSILPTSGKAVRLLIPGGSLDIMLAIVQK
ncbi:MAG: hypothetical protein HYT37_01815 [Candidatus Sungbacteria bacterium]|nr:hypothetical protein [Candidatus Sungbacteria bacterium]